MKAMILVFFTLLLCVCLNAQIAVAPAQGTGTITNPYHIANFGNLFWVAQMSSVWNQHFIQTADIDASDSALINDPAPNTSGWIPIGNGSVTFSGSYDGQGYRVFNLVLHRPSLQFAGLFGYMQGAKLNRIHLRDVSITGNNYTGGLAGVANSGSVVNNCSTTGSVTGMVNVGGLLGYCDGSGTTNSYSHTNVYSTSDQVGGFVGLTGWNNSTYHIFCFSTGAVIAPNANYKGGFTGRQGSTTVRDCYWDLQSSGITTDPAAIGKSTADMKQRATYKRWNFHNQWNIQENVSYPHLDGLLYHARPAVLTLDDLMGYGTPESPYLLLNADQLNVMRQNLSAHYILMDDIDLNASVAWNLGTGWEPVGTSVAPFTGTFDGNGHTISGLSISRPTTDFQGLFGYTSGAVIRRVKFDDVHILGKTNCGGVTGYAASGRLDEINLQGTILAFSASGGIVGVILDGSLQRAWADVDMKSYSDYAGGLVGYITSTGIPSGVVSNSGSTGAIDGNYNIGGVVGMVAWGYVLNSYSHAAVKGTYQVGGLVGTVGWSNPGYISRCFATGTVTLNSGGSYSGGLVGRMMAGNIRESYWDMQSSGIATNSGTGAIGKTTAEMMLQNTYLRWNFNTIWQMGSRNGYPVHRDLSIYDLPLAQSTANLIGSGTPGDPYVIQTINDLNVMRQAPSASYYISNDLDLSATCVWNGGKGWEPVGTGPAPFTGILDGAGKQLSNLSIEMPDRDYSGLFGFVQSSLIKDISLTDVNLHAKNYLGAVAGYSLLSRIDMASVHGTLSGIDAVGGIVGELMRGVVQRGKANVTLWAESSFAGGIAGAVSSDGSFNSSVSTCEADGYVRALYHAGGLVGYLSYGALINSSSHATVQANIQGGGAVGTCGWSSPASIVRCYSTGLVITEPGGYHIGGLVGRLQNGQVYDNYWDTERSGMVSNSGTATGLTTAAMKQQASYPGWNFDSLWQISQGVDYPRIRDLSIHQDPVVYTVDQLLGSGTEGDPYVIQSTSHLNAVRQNMSAHYLVIEDLDMAATLIWNGGRGWLPLGSTSQPFTGTINGNNKVISNLNIIAPLTNNAGFMGHSQNATVSDLKLHKIGVVGNDNLGGLAGSANGCSFSGVSVDGSMFGINAIGGLIGVVSGGAGQRCSSNAVAIGSGHYISALFGSVQGDAQVTQCSSTGSASGNTLIGGLAGELLQGTITDSFTHATVKGDINLGGAIGRIGWGSAGHLMRCYSTGNVVVNPGGYFAGGLVGSLNNGSIQASYWDMNSSGMSSSSGTGATGLSTVQMTYPQSQYNYPSWDFSAIWRHDVSSTQNNGYPYHLWSEAPVPDAVANLQVYAADGQIQLSWTASANVSQYNVYVSEDPYAPWNQWTLYTQTGATGIVLTAGEKLFFMVKAVGD